MRGMKHLKLYEDFNRDNLDDLGQMGLAMEHNLLLGDSDVDKNETLRELDSFRSYNGERIHSISAMIKSTNTHRMQNDHHVWNNYIRVNCTFSDKTKALITLRYSGDINDYWKKPNLVRIFMGLNDKHIIDRDASDTIMQGALQRYVMKLNLERDRNPILALLDTWNDVIRAQERPGNL